MCRFLLYLGPPVVMDELITRPEHSLIHQSIRSREAIEPLNGDGFGVAWYVPDLSDRPARFRAITPAWSNHNLLDLARVTRSHCVLAHVRAATRGLPVTETNCHPFTWEKFAFMHNGHVPHFLRLRRALAARLSDEAYHSIQGTTDSEHVFGLFRDHYRRGGAGGASGRALANALAAAIAEVVEVTREAEVHDPIYLNLAVTDGRHAVVSRYVTGDPEKANSLYLQTGSRYRCEGGVAHMDDTTAGASGAVLVSSEPLSQGSRWTRVPPNHLVIVGPGEPVVTSPLPGAG
jgi:ergothioneine biosynthesis protein EgtC